jgi:hypothetical protein
VAWQDGAWQIVVDGKLLKDFGRRQTDCRAGLRLIRDLGLSQMGTIGSARPIMEYWLAQGRAPLGPVAGLATSPIDLDSLRVEAIQSQWCLRDRNRVWFNFGAHPEDAKEAQAVFLHYRFNQVGLIGQGMPAMMVFFASEDRGVATANLLPKNANTAARKDGWKVENGGTERGSLSFAQAAPPANTEPRLPPPSPLKAKPSFPDRSNASPAQAPTSPSPVAKQLAVPPEVVLTGGSVIERMTFDNRQLRVWQDGHEWKIGTREYTLANYGRDERGARKALEILQHYRCSECNWIGQSRPIFSYFLSSGQPPRGWMFGQTGLAFRAEALQVQQTGSAWVISDGTRVLFQFGEQEKDARQALAKIQHYRFDHLVRLGGEGTSGPLTLFVKAY